MNQPKQRQADEVCLCFVKVMKKRIASIAFPSRGRWHGVAVTDEVVAER